MKKDGELEQKSFKQNKKSIDAPEKTAIDSDGGTRSAPSATGTVCASQTAESRCCFVLHRASMTGKPIVRNLHLCVRGPSYNEISDTTLIFSREYSV